MAPKPSRYYCYELHLPLYSGRFSTVELDFSYYAMPQAGQLEAIEPLLREKRLEKVLFQFPPEGASRGKRPNADTDKSGLSGDMVKVKGGGIAFTKPYLLAKV